MNVKMLTMNFKKKHISFAKRHLHILHKTYIHTICIKIYLINVLTLSMFR